MSYQVFARKYRPKSFDDVLGQDHVVRTLRNAITQSRLAHAYLFVGPRGTGKTSTARIFAKALNCTNGPSAEFDPDEELCREIAEGRCLDVLEIDGASNNGVEQVRELRDNVKFAPSRCRFKIYYIDEVHMLTAAAFNALLKTLEEPPEHVKFIFATTEPNKILPTIISRCQRFDLRRIPTPVIAEHLLHIAKLEGVDLEEKAAFAIAKGAEGGMRDAQSMLDQLVAFCGSRIEEANVLEIFGFTSAETVGVLAGQILGSDTVGALKVVHEQSEGGKDLGRLLGDLIQYVRTLLVFQADPEAALEDLVPEVAQMVSQQAGQASAPQLLRVVDGLAEVDARMRWATNKRLHFELGVIQAVQHINEVSLDDVIRALDQGNTDGVRQPVAQRAPEASPRRAPVASAPRGSAAEIRDPEEQAEGAGGLGLAAQLRQMRAEQQSSGQKPAARVATPAAAAAEAPAVEVKSAGDQGGSPQAAMIPGIDRMEVFWPEFVQAVTKARPLISNWVQVARCLELTRREARLGFALRDHAAADQLRKPDMLHFLEATAEGLVGHPMRVSLEVDADLVRPTDAEIDALLAPRAATVSAVEQEVAGGGESAEAELDKASGAEPMAAEAEVEDSADPLIKKAVEIFRLKHFPDEGTSE